ncbi:MAG TPA: hypothetical protein VIG86_08440 [Candidatus Dormibacteraeota bacterium]
MISGRPARCRAGLAVAALALLALAAVRSGGGGPPLYDGLCLPPNYLVLGANPGPSSASATYSADQLNQTQELATTEQTPQAQLIMAAGSLTAPAGATVTLTIKPVPPPSIQPAAGTIVGNVYQFAARASTGPTLSLAAGHPATVVLEAPRAGGPNLTVERFDTSTWTPLKTFQSGCGDTDEAASPSLGLFALVAQGSAGAGSPNPPSSGGPPVAVIVVAMIIVVLALAIGATRRSRGRPRRGGQRKS